VAEQVLVADAGYEQVGAPVVVEVAYRATKARAWTAQPCLCGYVGEDAVAVVAQKQIAHLAFIYNRAEEEQIELAVAVVIERHDRSAEAGSNRCSHLPLRNLAA